MLFEWSMWSILFVNVQILLHNICKISACVTYLTTLLFSCIQPTTPCFKETIKMEITDDLIVPFGKYKGKHINSLLADKAYLQWCKTNNIITEQKYPHIYNTIYCVNVLPNKEDTPTPEHNDMQNKFLNKSFQVCLLKHLYHQQLRSIAKSFTPEIEQNYGTYNDTIDDRLLDCVQSVTFEEKFNWDVVINVSKTLNFKSVHYKSFVNKISEVVQKLKSNYDQNNISYKSLCDLILSCDDVDIDVKMKLKSNLERDGLLEDHTKYNSENVWEHYKIELLEIYRDIKFPERYKHQHCYSCCLDDDYGCVSICCEIKPTLGDDYPCVLRKMKQQLEHTSKYINNTPFSSKPRPFNHLIRPILVIKDYNSKVTSLDTLKEIFKQHKISVLLLSDINTVEKDKHHYTLEELNKLLQEKVNTLTAENEYLRQQLLLK